MSNIATSRKRCRMNCPRGNYAFMGYGDLVECGHGAVFMVCVKSILWEGRYHRGNFRRLHPFWTPILWRRAQQRLREFRGGENGE